MDVDVCRKCSFDCRSICNQQQSHRVPVFLFALRPLVRRRCGLLWRICYRKTYHMLLLSIKGNYIFSVEVMRMWERMTLCPFPRSNYISIDLYIQLRISIDVYLWLFISPRDAFSFVSLWWLDDQRHGGSSSLFFVHNICNDRASLVIYPELL